MDGLLNSITHAGKNPAAGSDRVKASVASADSLGCGRSQSRKRGGGRDECGGQLTDRALNPCSSQGPPTLVPKRRNKRKRPRTEILPSSDEGGCVKTPAGNAGVTSGFVKPIPRYLLVKNQGEGKSFKETSPFFIARTLDLVCGGPVLSAKKLADGSLLVNCDKKHSLALQKCTDFGGVPVLVEPHKDLNTSKGVIFCFDLAYVSEDECRQEMASQGVVDCRKMKTRAKGKPSASMVLTFASDKLPDKVCVGYNVCNVRAYIPNPLRCYTCHRYGHSSARCGKQAICGQCGQAKHDADPCPNPVYCVNCRGSHPASSQDCPTYQEEKAIMSIKTKKRISYFEAKKEHKLLAPPVFARSYATVASVAVKKFNMSTQTEVVSCSVQTEPLVVLNVVKEVEPPVTQTAVQAPTTGEPGLDKISPAGLPTPKSSPSKQVEIRQRISPVTAPQGSNPVAAKSTPSREPAPREPSRQEPARHETSREGNSRREFSRPELARRESAHPEQGTSRGTGREPNQWYPAKNRPRKSLPTPVIRDPEKMAVDPQPPASIKLVRPRGSSPKPKPLS